MKQVISVAVRMKIFVGDKATWLRGSVVFSSQEGEIFDIAVIHLHSELLEFQTPMWSLSSVTEGTDKIEDMMVLCNKGAGFLAEADQCDRAWCVIRARKPQRLKIDAFFSCRCASVHGWTRFIRGVAQLETLSDERRCG